MTKLLSYHNDPAIKEKLEALSGNNEMYAETCRAALREVIDFCEREIKTELAAWSAARSAAESGHYLSEKDELLKLLKEAK